MVSYVDYEYYIESFFGKSIPEESFAGIAKDASAFIREITSDRISPDNLSDDVKNATCAVCDVVYSEEMRIQKTGGVQEIKSMSTDGESISYTTEVSSEKSREDVMREKKYAAARPYLLHTDLLYRGCY